MGAPLVERSKPIFPHGALARQRCKHILRAYSSCRRRSLSLVAKNGSARICERVDIRKLLERSLAEEHPRSLYALAVSLGYTNEGYIQRKFPQLCSAIREKIRSEKRARISNMEEALKSALTEQHPPSLDEVRKRLAT